MNVRNLTIVLCGLLPLIACASVHAASGSHSGNPILIGTVSELEAIRTNIGSSGSPVYYKQTADLDLSGVTNWEPIGSSSSTRAYIHYDGGHHSLSNLHISQPGEYNVGLFGHLVGSVSNLTFASSHVRGYARVGALVGTLYGSSSSISHCLVEQVDVEGLADVASLAGGIVGWLDGGQLDRVAYRGGTVSGQSIGGLVGGISSGTVTHSYAAAQLDGSGGGLAGVGTGTISGSYWDTDVSGTTTTSGGGIGLTTSQMMEKASFEGWDFEGVWQLYESYPYHRSLAERVAALVFDPAGGTFVDDVVPVTVSSDTANATIHYTLGDRETPRPTTPTTIAVGASIDVAIPGILRAVAWAPYMNPYPAESYMEAVYDAAPPASQPIVSPGSGTYTGTVHLVTIESATTDAAIYYTLDHTEPSEASLPVPPNGEVFVPIPSTLQARAYHPAFSPSTVTTVVYTAAETVWAPTFDPGGGAFSSTNVDVTVSSSTEDAIIRYTLDGSEPTSSSTGVPSESVISVPIPATLKARAFKTNMNTSAVTEAAYVEAGKASMPTFSPDGGSIASGNVHVTVESADPGATIHYTTDDSVPDTSSPHVESGEVITVPVPATLRAIVYAPDVSPSDVRSASFETADVTETPVFSEEWHENGDEVTVTMTSSSPAATILYALDGSDPMYDGLPVPSGSSVTVTQPATVRARAQSDGLFMSPMRTAFYGDFAGGDGTPENPYLIANAEQLNRVRYDLEAHYKLVDPIDLAGWNEGQGWEPIGVFPDAFMGTFDGAGHRVDGLSIDKGTAEDVGLFGYVGANGVVKAVGVQDADVTGKKYVGSIVGYLSGRLEQVFGSGVVTGETDVGGIAGRVAFSGHIEDAYASSTVHGTDNVGGAVGQNSQGSIWRVYSTGMVTGASRVGGLVGNSAVLGDTLYAYWDVDTSGISVSDGGVGRSTAEMMQQSTYVSWDFDTIWSLDIGNDYPRLRVFGDISGANMPPESWMTRFYGSPEAAPDFSIKGNSLWHEYVAGTDPTDSDSVFRVIEVVQEGATDTIALVFPSVTDRRYRVAVRSDLVQGNWEVVSGVEVTGTGDLLFLEVPRYAAPTYYQLLVDLLE